MFKKLCLVMLIPFIGGCIFHGGRGRGHDGHRIGVRSPVVVSHGHAHSGGCGHILRAGVWIAAN